MKQPDSVFLLCLVAVLAARSAGVGAPTLPIIPAYSTNVTQAPYNALGDGVSDDTTAIQNAINDVSARGGGTVQIPGPGIYLSGPLTLKSRINLQIDAGATLRMRPYGSWTGTSPLLSCSSLSNVQLSGAGGIDGQGAGWWVDNLGSGLYMIYFNNCNTVLVQNLTVSNAPKQQIVFKGKSSNITVRGLTIRAPSSHATPPSHNTDGIDLVGTNCLVQDCDISTGDDNIAIGSSGGGSVGILVTNCTFGVGHGMTIGSHTEGGVADVTVIDCTFSGTDYGIRMKSDNDRGGLAQNLWYLNLGMTNLRYTPLCIHSYYNSDNDPIGVSPATAAAMAVGSVTQKTPIWRNVLVSNLTATVASGGQAGILWGRKELPITNVILSHAQISAPANFDLYNVSGFQFLDSQITVPGASTTFSLYNAQLAISNRATPTTPVSLDGLVSTNALALCNARASMNDAALLGINPLTLSGSTLSNNTDVALPASSAVNFALGTNAAVVALSGSLDLNSTLNVSNAGGLCPGTYPLFRYGGTLRGTLRLGAVPPGFGFRLDTNTAHQVNLVAGADVVLEPPALSSGNAFEFGVSGAPGCAYSVLASSNLVDWFALVTNTAPFLFADTNVLLFSNRFYRAVSVP